MILVTGGAGYIGSHTVKILQAQNYDVVVFDNLSRGHLEAIPSGTPFEKVDLVDYSHLKKVIKKYDIAAVIHFAGLAYVDESVKRPDLYYTNNTIGSLNLLNVLKEENIHKIVFSSTCSLYGNPRKIPVCEDQPEHPINPYAKTKYIIENFLKDYAKAFFLKYVSLRYFNAAGADFGCSIGEQHNPETHLIPRVLQAALDRTEVCIFGDDYDTKDGTCIRDYIHVNDLAEAHIEALRYLDRGGDSTIINLGTGVGYSIKEIIKMAQDISRVELIVKTSHRRFGDPAILIANNQRAKEILNWQPRYNLSHIIESAWNWHRKVGHLSSGAL